MTACFSQKRFIHLLLFIAGKGIQALGDVPYFAGVSVGALLPNPARCKSTLDYQADFETIKSWSSSPFTVIHTYSTSACSSLLNIVPAAMMAGFGIWPTVFQGSQFNADKAALADAINEFGSQWLVGVSVGNKALRTGYKSEDLATEIWAVRELLENMGIEGVVVGLNDNEPTILDPINKPAIDASTVLWATVYPFYAGVQANESGVALQESFSRLVGVSQGKPIVIGETGWPTNGPPDYGASTGFDELQTYWQHAACWLQSQQISWAWFEAFDESWKVISHFPFPPISDTKYERRIVRSRDPLDCVLVQEEWHHQGYKHPRYPFVATEEKLSDSIGKSL